MNTKEILTTALSYFKSTGNQDVEISEIFGIAPDDDNIEQFITILSQYPFITVLHPNGLLGMSFMISPDWYQILLSKTPEDFLKFYYQYAKEHNEEILKKKERKRKEDQLLELSIEDLANRIIDNPKVNARLQRSEIISGISALAAIISTIVAIKSC